MACDCDVIMTIGVTYHTPTAIFNFYPAGAGLALFNESDYV